jgi:hypothetical protein
MVLIPGLSFTHSNTGNLFSLDTSEVIQSPRKLLVQVLLGSDAGSFLVSGNIMVYGQRL